MPFQFQIATPPVVNIRMFDVIANLGLTSNLKVCLDAGDSASYSSGQKWLDVSGGGYDFFLGADNSATTDDPTFNGTVGRQSAAEYWTFDGGDLFKYDTTSEAWMDAMHKDSAAWTFATWIYVPSGSAHIGILGSAGVPNEIGVIISFDQSINTLYTIVSRLSGNAFLTTIVTDLDTSGWKFLAITIDEANNAFRGNIQGSSYSATCTFSGPSSSAASSPMRLGATTARYMPNGSRMSCAAIWEGVALTAGQMDALFQNTRSKFSV